MNKSCRFFWLFFLDSAEASSTWWGWTVKEVARTAGWTESGRKAGQGGELSGSTQLKKNAVTCSRSEESTSMADIDSRL